MAAFTGTTQKCKACEKTVYLVDQLTADNKVFHKSCFRCHHCKGTLKVKSLILINIVNMFLCSCMLENYAIYSVNDCFSDMGVLNRTMAIIFGTIIIFVLL